MEDNSAVVIMANNESGYTKKCKHFLIILNYIKEQIALGQIEAQDLRQAKHRRHAQEASSLLQISHYGSQQDPRPTATSETV